MNGPLVSIIIPIYNVEAYLRECLNSVIVQTCRDWECILVDDASTDASGAIAREFCEADSRFRLIRHTENRGQSDARNSGLDAARGSRIMFLDSDDVVHPSIVELGAGERAEIVCFDLEYSRRRFMKSCRTHYADGRFIRPDSRTALRQFLYQTGRLNASPCGKIIDASLFSDVRFVSGLTYEDLEIVGRLLGNARTVADSPLKLYFYRQREGSYIHTWSRKRLDVLKVTESMEARLEADAELARAARDRRFAANFNMLLLMRKNGMGRSVEAEECRAQIRRLRGQVLTDSRSRLKNRAGALAAYLFMR